MTISASFTAVKNGRTIVHATNGQLLENKSPVQSAYVAASEWCALRGYVLESMGCVNRFSDDGRQLLGAITSGLEPEVVFEEEIRKMTALEATALLMRSDADIPAFLNDPKLWPADDGKWGAISAQATALHAFVLRSLAEKDVLVTDLPCMAHRDALSQKARDLIGTMTHEQLYAALEMSTASVTQDDPLDLVREIARQEFSLCAIYMDDLQDAIREDEGQIINEDWGIINRLDREQLEAALAAHSIASYDHESDADLGQAIAANVADGTIDLSELEALLYQQRGIDRQRG